MTVYFNNAATSHPKPEAVYREINNYMRNIGINLNRGSYLLNLDISSTINRTRALLASLFNAPKAEQIIFTKNATESINLGLKGLLSPGDHIICTGMDHNAVVRPLKHLENTLPITVSEANCSREGFLTPSEITKHINANTKLIIVTHASNVTGTIIPLTEIGSLAAQHNITFMVDAAQTAGIVPIDVIKDQIDILAFTGHKGLMGPTGTGGIYIREGLDLTPLIFGGTGHNSLPALQPQELPDRYEGGTLNVLGIVGLKAALEFIMDTGIENIRISEKLLTSYLVDKLQSLNNVTIYGSQNAEQQTALVSFNIDPFEAQDIGMALDQLYGIMVRTGLHCSPKAHRTTGTLDRNGTVRVSLGYFNTTGEIDYLIDCLGEIIKKGGS